MHRHVPLQWINNFHGACRRGIDVNMISHDLLNPKPTHKPRGQKLRGGDPVKCSSGWMSVLGWAACRGRAKAGWGMPQGQKACPMTTSLLLMPVFKTVYTTLCPQIVYTRVCLQTGKRLMSLRLLIRLRIFSVTRLTSCRRLNRLRVFSKTKTSCLLVSKTAVKTCCRQS